MSTDRPSPGTPEDRTAEPDDFPVPAPGTLRRGMQLGEYRVTRFIGRGGMGVVYEGIHTLLRRKVAIKVISERFAHNDEAGARFLQEARAASALRHPNIVDLFAFDKLPDGRYYQVMELLEGRTLCAVIKERAPFPLPLVRAVLQGLLAALDFAQRKGIIHRDVKPENIFITGSVDGPPSQLSVKILDFGLAKMDVGSSLVKSRTGVPMGTPPYMSPEQCRGISEVDGRTDIYAAGVLLYEMLTGHVPFLADSAVEIMSQQITRVPAPLSKLVPVTPAIEAVALKALAKQPANRFQSAAEMLAAWEKAYEQAVAAGAPSTKLTEAVGGPRRPAEAAKAEAAAVQTLKSISPVTPPAGFQRTRSWLLSRRRPYLMLVIGAAAAVVLGVIGPGGTAPGPGTPVAAMEVLVPVVVPAAEQQLRAYVDKAERLARDQRVEHAIELAAQARALPVEHPELRARLAQVDRQIESTLVLRQAEKHQQAGNLDLALQLAKQAFDRYSDDGAAARLIAEIRQAQADQAPRTPTPVRRPPATARVHRATSLTGR